MGVVHVDTVRNTRQKTFQMCNNKMLSYKIIYEIMYILEYLDVDSYA